MTGLSARHVRLRRSVTPSLVAAALAAAFFMGTVAPSDADARVLRVNCDNGLSVQSGLDRASPGDTVQVDGICTENISISTANLSLVAGPNGGISAADPSASVIEVVASNIRIEGLAISGGRNGIIVTRNGAAVIEGNMVSGYNATGVVVAQNSYARMRG